MLAIIYFKSYLTGLKTGKKHFSDVGSLNKELLRKAHLSKREKEAIIEKDRKVFSRSVSLSWP